MIMYWIRRFFRLFLHRAFWVLMLVVVLSLCIWHFGPLFAFAEHRPLESTVVRWRIIGTLFFLYFFWLISLFWRRKGITGRILARFGRMKQSVAEKTEQAAQGDEFRELQARFTDATKTLRHLRVQGISRGFFWRRRFLYELPWYVFIGPSGAGKTTALRNAGLNFTGDPDAAKSAMSAVTATQHCDWSFTDQAVLIDTAGRYVTHDSDDAAADKSEWMGFLGLLKKHRPRQPVNGVVLTLSVEQLLTLTDTEMEKRLQVMRERLSEVQATFSIEIPVYVWITKMDQLAGFSEFFREFNPRQREQVLGFTFPYSDTARSNRPDLEMFDQQWHALEQSIFSVQDAHLARESEVRRRNFIYAFPQQFSGLHLRVRHLMEKVFAPTRLERQPVLRGFFFCSGTQGSEAYDRVLGSLEQRFASAGPVNAPAPNGQASKGHFLHDLLVKLMFGESHLAGRDRRWEKRSRRLTYLGYSLTGLALCVVLTGWFISYRNNLDYLRYTDAQAQIVAGAIERHDNNVGSLSTLLDLLHDTRHVPDTPEFRVHEPPMPNRWGLYQGYRVDEAAQAAYQRLLDNGLQPLVASRIESQLSHPPVQDLEYLYEALKGYLMLYEPEHYQAVFLRQWVGADLRRFVLPDADPETLERADAHVDALFAAGQPVSSPYPRNTSLTQSVRERLSSLSTAQRAYERLRGRLMNNELGEFNMLDAAGPQAANVFVRKSGQPLNRGIPGLFTYQGYWTLFDKSVNSVVSELGEDEGWVLGLPGKNARSQLADAMRGKLVREVRMLFLREYQQRWVQFMQDFELIPSGSLNQSMQRLSVLSAPDSPLPLFLRAVVRETTLLRELEKNQQSALDRMTSRIKNTRDEIERVIGPVELARSARMNRDERIVDDFFEPLRRLVGHPASPSQGSFPIDAVMKTLDEYYSTLVATDAAVRSGMAPPPADAAIRLKSEATRLPAPLGQMLGTIAAQSSQQTSTLVRGQIGANLNATVGDFCRRAVQGRYPLNRNSTSDVTPQDFARLFGPGGTMDDFFTRNLAGSVDTTTWTFKKNIDGSHSGSGTSLVAFQKASVIRNVFFGHGESVPKLRLEMRVLEMDPSIINMALDVDGTILRYAHGPQINQALVWPGPRGRQEVLLQVFDKSGGQSAIKTDGAWALHRLFDKLVIAGATKPETFTATASVNGRRVMFEVTTSSVQNPFRLSHLQTFQCPGSF